MSKRYLINVVLAALALFLLSAGTGTAGSQVPEGMEPVGLTVNGQEASAPAPALLIGETPYIPLQAVSESLGAKVEWNSAARMITIALQEPEGQPRPEVILTPAAATPTGPFSQAMRSAEWVHVAGMRGILPNTNQQLAEGDEARVRQAFENIKAILEAAGTDLGNVVSTRVYVRDMFRHRPIVNQLYEEYFQGTYPPRTIVEVLRLNQDDIVEIEVDAWIPPAGQRPEIILTDAAARPTGPFSQAMKAGNYLFVAGMRGILPNTDQQLAEGDQARIRQAFENVRAILEAAGTDLAHVVTTRVYVSDMFRYRPMVNEAYQEYFGDRFPPRTIVEVTRLNQDDIVEIDVVAVLPALGSPEIIFTDRAASPTGPFSQAMRVGDRVYVAGMRGILPKSNQDLVPGTENRVRMAFENIKEILEASGTSLAHVTRTRVYVRDMFRHRPIVNQLYEEYFQGTYPPRTIVEISRLNQDDEVEIEVEAWVPDR